jgi:hypothetical protein
LEKLDIPDKPINDREENILLLIDALERVYPNFISASSRFHGQPLTMTLHSPIGTRTTTFAYFNN